MVVIVVERGVALKANAEATDEFVEYSLYTQAITPARIHTKDRVDLLCEEGRRDGGRCIVVCDELLDHLDNFDLSQIVGHRESLLDELVWEAVDEVRKVVEWFGLRKPELRFGW
jgi:hypothetical protein